ncbi:MAG: hypothetical protein Q9224_001769 [Gallowayella concinna]
MADSTPKSYHTDPTLYLYTSLTAGSSHIITATSRLETILKANRIPYQALDVATDEKARMLWGRRAGKRKLPGLVRMGMLVGVRHEPFNSALVAYLAKRVFQDLEEIEEWNEYGELKDKVGVKPMPSTPSAANTPSKPPPSTPTANTPSKLLSPVETPSRQTSSSNTDSPMATAMRQAGLEAAKKAGDAKTRALAKAKGAESTTTGTLTKHEALIEQHPSAGEDVATTKAPVTEATKPASTVASSGDGGDDTDERLTNEGDGSKDPDEEAVVSGSKDTIDVEDDATAGTNEGSSRDPNAEAGVSGSKDTVEAEKIAANGTKQSETEDPDAEAVVPGSKNTGVPEKEVQAIHDSQAGGSDKKDGDDVNNDGIGKRGGENAIKATAATNDTENLPGKRTQDQAAAKAEEAGTSVAD